MTDLIDRIDDLVKPTCGDCGAPLTHTGPSDLFCNEACQERWHGHGPDLRGLSVTSVILDEAFPRSQEHARGATLGLQREDGTWMHCSATDVRFDDDMSRSAFPLTSEDMQRDILAAFDLTASDLGLLPDMHFEVGEP